MVRSRPTAAATASSTARGAGKCEMAIDFSIAISHFPAPRAVLDAVAAAVGRERTMPYTGVGGALDVRTRLAAKLRRENGIEASPDEIIVTNGAKQALYEALYAI